MTAIGYAWKPFLDLSDEDLAAASDELPALASVWKDERDRFGDDQALVQFNERLQREWAIETGVIERVYSLDKGTTQLLIEQGIDVSLISHDSTDQPPEIVAAIIKDQYAAVEWLFDFVAARRELSTSFVKELHALMTRNQRTAAGVDQLGRASEVELLHGEYKRWPNNPLRPDGQVHEYCPPEQVDIEMERLVGLHLRHEAEDVPPEVSSAWLHHRFTQIHPFQDGNGRVARALASLVFLRRGWFPLVITRDERSRYIETLEAADGGDLVPLVELFATRQKTAFVGALGIAREVAQETERVDQVLSSIGDLFARRDAELAQEQEKAKSLAEAMRSLAEGRLTEIAEDIKRLLGRGAAGRWAFMDSTGNDDKERRNWHRAQVIEATRRYGYFAGFGEYASWVRLGLDTENGRSEIIVSFHAVGRDYRGVIGAAMVFFRKSDSDSGARQPMDVVVVGDEPFQINYKEAEEAVRPRFVRWLERGLVEALDTWRRSE